MSMKMRKYTQVVKRFSPFYLLTLLPFYLFTSLLLFSSCGTNNGKFRLEGRLRNFNNGEFWIYTPDGDMLGFDTIKVRDGRFSYEREIDEPMMMIVEFPNYSEQPIFAEPGAKVTIKGDATHMKEMIIEGTEENEDMTMLRMKLNDLTPPDIPDAISEYIKENRDTRVSIYLLHRYFAQTDGANYRKARALTDMLLEKQPDNPGLLQLQRKLRNLENCAVNTMLPKFTATDIKGKQVTEADLKGKVSVVTAWATWSYQSVRMQQRLKQFKNTYGDKLGVLSVCLDGQADICRRYIAHDSLKWSTVCDGRMWETPLMQKFGFGDIPSNLLLDAKGRVVARSMTEQELEERLKKLIPQ